MLRFGSFDIRKKIACTQSKKNKPNPIFYCFFRTVKAPSIYIAKHKQRKTTQYNSQNGQLMSLTIHKNGGCTDTQ